MKKKHTPTDISSSSEKDIFSELYMSNKFTVLVESHKDEKVFSKFFDLEKCRFYPQNGKYKLIELLSKVKQNKIDNRIIGIIDADFCRINNTPTEFENLFLTDKHDIELMMMFSEAWQHVIHHYTNPEKLVAFEREKKDNLLNILLQIAFPLSCLRWLREDKKLENIKFRRYINKEIKYLKYQDFVNEKTLIINKQDLIRAVENISEQPHFFAKNKEYINDWEIYQTQQYDLGEFSNGYDILHILSIALQKAISNRANAGKIEAETLAENLSMSYRFADFQQTNLYHNIAIWQANHYIFILKTA